MTLVSQKDWTQVQKHGQSSPRYKHCIKFEINMPYRNIFIHINANFILGNVT